MPDRPMDRVNTDTAQGGASPTLPSIQLDDALLSFFEGEMRIVQHPGAVEVVLKDVFEKKHPELVTQLRSLEGGVEVLNADLGTHFKVHVMAGHALPIQDGWIESPFLRVIIQDTLSGLTAIPDIPLARLAPSDEATSILEEERSSGCSFQRASSNLRLEVFEGSAQIVLMLPDEESPTQCSMHVQMSPAAFQEGLSHARDKLESRDSANGYSYILDVVVAGGILRALRNENASFGESELLHLRGMDVSIESRPRADVPSNILFPQTINLPADPGLVGPSHGQIALELSLSTVVFTPLIGER